MAFLKRTLFENHNQSSYDDDENEDKRASSAATLQDVLVALPPLVSQSLETRRPILHHLNADTSWLLQLPRPDAGAERSGGRRFYNILFDPWLSGPQSDVASWFSRQWHVIPPALGSIAEVEQLCTEAERLGSGALESLAEDDRPLIDLVVISHEFTDHCHEQTLRQCDGSIPVLATTKAAPMVQKWKHFDTVIDMPGFKSESGSDSDWRETAISPLPPWLGISRLVTGKDALYYHSAVMLAFNLDPAASGKQPDGAEAVIYTPHGIQAQSLAFLPSIHPSIKTLALLHGLHDVSIDWGQQLNLGAVNGLEAQQALRARYWIGTHDEVKKGGGVVSWFLRRRVWTVDDAIAEENKMKKQKEKDQAERDKTKALLDGEYLDMKSGDSKVLA